MAEYVSYYYGESQFDLLSGRGFLNCAYPMTIKAGLANRVYRGETMGIRKVSKDLIGDIMLSGLFGIVGMALVVYRRSKS